MGRLGADYSNQKYNYLLALQPSKIRKTNRILWDFRCDCGNIKSLNPTEVRYGHIKSGGCKKSELASKNQSLPEGEGAFRSLLRSYIKSSHNRNLEFNLSDDEFRHIIKQNCYYCGNSPSKKFKVKGRNHVAYSYNGIDRVDNNLGYILENCVPCCETCNFMKRVMGYEEFLEHIESIYKYRILYR